MCVDVQKHSINVTISSILDLRILVLTLGETTHAGWWKSQFLSPTGLNFLEHIYPRSKFAAAVRSAGRAARVVHDANVGKGEVFHLFRLSRAMEREIDAVLSEQSNELEVQFRPLLADRAELLARLDALVGEPPEQSPVGPMQLAVGSGDWLPVMTAAYQSAFEEEVQVFPYFKDEKVSR